KTMHIVLHEYYKRTSGTAWSSKCRIYVVPKLAIHPYEGGDEVVSHTIRDLFANETTQAELLSASAHSHTPFPPASLSQIRPTPLPTVGLPSLPFPELAGNPNPTAASR
uniref:Uncharacterized protein n=1 Tax=Aegilops tauschii subsp. strangulata TaxID=200361 RepID=A0A453P3F3_AEGTS